MSDVIFLVYEFSVQYITRHCQSSLSFPIRGITKWYKKHHKALKTARNLADSNKICLYMYKLGFEYSGA